MNKLITDDKVIRNLQNEINLWINHEIGDEVSGQVLLSEIFELSEYFCYCLRYTVELETRKANGFSRAAAANEETSGRLMMPEQIDPWSVKNGDSTSFVERKKLVEVEESKITVPCKKCTNTGNANCPDCNGQKAVFCTECHGDGKKHCPVCKRTRKASCLHCGGRGQIYLKNSDKYESCMTCNGKGSVFCTTCTDGYVACSACGGKGRFPCVKCNDTGIIKCPQCLGSKKMVSGIAVEIICSVVGEKIEINDEEVPGDIVADILKCYEYQPYLTLNNEVDYAKAMKANGISAEVQKGYERLKSLLSISGDRRVVQTKLEIGKKSVYRLKCELGGVEDTIWTGYSESKIYCKKEILETVHNNELNEINSNIMGDDLFGALNSCTKKRHSKTFSVLLPPIIKDIKSRILLSYGIGVFLGFILSTCIILPIIYSWRSMSLHLGFLILACLFLNVIAGGFSGVALYLINPKILGKKFKRIAGGTAAVVLMLLFSYSFAGYMKFDPARKLDSLQMQKEYKKQFPFGLRTLSNKEDIVFLENMVNKYEPTGIDLASIKRELAWLQSKQGKDERNIKKIQKAMKSIKATESGKKNQKKTDVRRKKGKISIK